MYTLRIQRQDTPHTAPYWQEFLYNGTGDDSIATALRTLNEHTPLQTKDGREVSPIGWQCSCMVPQMRCLRHGHQRPAPSCLRRIFPRISQIYHYDCTAAQISRRPRPNRQSNYSAYSDETAQRLAYDRKSPVSLDPRTASPILALSAMRLLLGNLP